MIKVINVCGARPNFVKIAPLMRAFADCDRTEPLLVHTGQHYDRNMSDEFFTQLDIPEPDVNLGVGSASHAIQTAEIMRRFEPVVLEHQPDWVLVVGDVNSTIACALVAAKVGVKVAHVEAGLRSFDRSMPEEINRVLTDSISDLLFVTERSGLENLKREGIDGRKVHFVGNVMIDTLLAHRDKANESTILQQLEIEAGRYVVVTLHRPSNVDDPALFGPIIEALAQIGAEMPVIFPAHPRTRERISRLAGERLGGIRLLDPVGYLDFIKLMADAAAVLTDSGGIQEETTILGVPCFTLRPNTERPVTIEQGTNRLVPPNGPAICTAWREFRENPPPAGRQPELWDGRAAQRIVECLCAEGSN